MRIAFDQLKGRDSGQHRGQNREVLREIVGDREGSQRAAGHQELLADLHDLDQLGRIGVEIDHVAGFLRGLSSRIHGHADIGAR